MQKKYFHQKQFTNQLFLSKFYRLVCKISTTSVRLVIFDYWLTAINMVSGRSKFGAYCPFSSGYYTWSIICSLVKSSSTLLQLFLSYCNISIFHVTNFMSLIWKSPYKTQENQKIGKRCRFELAIIDILKIFAIRGSKSLVAICPSIWE